MDWLYKKLATGLARKLLWSLATWLVTQGVFDSKDLPLLATKIAEIAPALVALAWDYYEKSKDAKVLHVATQASGLSPAKIARDAKYIKLGQMP